MKEKIIVALSGGVDSAVAALLLKKQGYEVFGVYMQNWDSAINEYNSDQKFHCNNKESMESAIHVSKTLGIELKIYNFSAHYWKYVFMPFLEIIKEGKGISNPDIFCNLFIKFGILFEQIKKDFGDSIKIATGHYARIIKKDKKYYLSMCNNLLKDQTYFLSRLPTHILCSIIFPLSEFDNKSIVREIAKKHQLMNWNKVDSRGICFIGKRNFPIFLSNYLDLKGGLIIDIENNESLGHHKDSRIYAINQRLFIPGMKERYYVCKKDNEKNILYACKKSSLKQYLNGKVSEIENLYWFYEKPKINDILLIKTKHSPDTFIITIIDISESIILIKHKNLFLTTPGQFIVFYEPNSKICLGSGILKIQYHE